MEIDKANSIIGILVVFIIGIIIGFGIGLSRGKEVKYIIIKGQQVAAVEEGLFK